MEKNLYKGGVTWAYEKEILGWIFNFHDYTLRLPADKINKILGRIQNIKKFTTKKPRKVMEKLAGSLQNVLFGIPRGAGIFHLYRLLLKSPASGCASHPT